jgi:hypothetical protein
MLRSTGFVQVQNPIMVAAKYVLYNWHCSALRYAAMTWTSKTKTRA